MSKVVSLVKRQEQLAQTIADDIIQARNASPLVLPEAGDPIVRSYVKQIEGNYDTGRAKKDTDHAIDLLYIAYNTTPQAQGAIRVAISQIMDKLIDAQQNSERTVTDAVREAKLIGTELSETLPEWLDVKEEGDNDKIKTFVGEDLLALAQLIQERALQVNVKLRAVADSYDEIISDTTQATAKSELALSEVIKNNAELSNELKKTKARSKELESLVESITEQIASFHKLAEDYQARAESAESKSFWASLIQTVIQVTSVVLPVVALIGGAKATAVVGTAAVASVSNKIADNTRHKDAIEARERQAKLTSSRDQLQTDIDGKNQQIDELGTERQQLATDNNEALEEMDARIERLKGELKNDQDEHAKTLTALEEVEALILSLERKASSVSEQEKTQAGDLRKLQKDMFNRIEQYEKRRGEQQAELIKVRVLIAGERSESESNELAIRSLNLSIAAMKRTKEIVQEVATFFKSFSDYMVNIADASKSRIKAYEKVTANGTLRAYRLKKLKQSTDEFFIAQAGQWLAVSRVSTVFADTFKQGWSKLNKLHGHYITGEELQNYLSEAARKLDEIATSRNADQGQRLIDLDACRKNLDDKLDAELG